MITLKMKTTGSFHNYIPICTASYLARMVYWNKPLLARSSWATWST